MFESAIIAAVDVGSITLSLSKPYSDAMFLKLSSYLVARNFIIHSAASFGDVMLFEVM